MTSLKQYIGLLSSPYSPCLIYRGIVEHDKITEILKSINHLKCNNRKIRKAVYSISNELLENSRIHSFKKNNNYIEFGIYHKEDCIRIICINIAYEEDLLKLKKSFEDHNDSNINELKSAIKNSLLHGKISNKNTIGAGLNIVRLKTNNKILLSTEPYNHNKVRVLMDARLDK